MPHDIDGRSPPDNDEGRPGRGGPLDQAPTKRLNPNPTVGSKALSATTRYEYRVSWPRTDRADERRWKLFQLRRPAERLAAELRWQYLGVRLERRAVGDWHECREVA